MSIMYTIQQFIDIESEKTIKLELKQFFTLLHKHYYNTVDISFMDYFLSLVDKEQDNKFCVEQEKLKEYGVLNNIDTSGTIKRRLDALDLVEGEDYLLFNVVQQDLSHGGSNKKTYSLTPDAFKLCLIRAKNSKDYAKYYLLLEKVFKHYQDYQYLYQQKIMVRLDFQNKEFKEQNDKMNDSLNKIININEELKTTLNNTRDDLGSKLDITIDYLKQKSYTSTMNPKHKGKHHYCVLTRIKNNDNYKIKFISGQSNYVDKYIKNLDDAEKVVVEKFYNANGIDLRNNTYNEFINYRTQVISDLNEKNKIEVEKFNKDLKLEIKNFNKTNKDNKRKFSKEKRTNKFIKNKDIKIVFNKTNISYTENNYISYSEIIDLIKSVNNITQKSPINSDGEKE